MITYDNDGMVVFPGGHRAPMRRMIEWFVGHRPPPGYTEEQDQQYFKSAVDGGLITQRQAFDLHERHRQLTIVENGGDPMPVPAALEVELIRRGWTPPAS